MILIKRPFDWKVWKSFRKSETSYFSPVLLLKNMWKNLVLSQLIRNMLMCIWQRGKRIVSLISFIPPKANLINSIQKIYLWKSSKVTLLDVKELKSFRDCFKLFLPNFPFWSPWKHWEEKGQILCWTNWLLIKLLEESFLVAL